MKFVKMSNDKIKGFEPFFGPVRTTTRNSLEFRVCKKCYKIILSLPIFRFYNLFLAPDRQIYRVTGSDINLKQNLFKLATFVKYKMTRRRKAVKGTNYFVK